MAVDNLLQGSGPSVKTLKAVERQTPLQQVRIALLSGQVVIQNAFLQGGQRVDFLHVGGTARHAGDNSVDGGLFKRHQAQHVRSDSRTAWRNAVSGYLERLGVACGSVAYGQCSQGRLVEQYMHIGLQT